MHVCLNSNSSENDEENVTCVLFLGLCIYEFIVILVRARNILFYRLSLSDYVYSLPGN